MIKRSFDIIVSFLGLVVLTPLLLLLAVVIKLDSPGPIFFRQERIGKGFRPFFIFKFRTMLQDLSDQGRLITVGDDPRITRVGRFLRKSKFDELPQLINVLKGDMSLVGPRPEVRRYVELFQKDYEQILKIRPGITDLASLKYHNEAAVLEGFDNPEAEYCNRILPDKISLSKEYVKKSSFIFDLALIVKTLPKIFGHHSVRIIFFRDSA
jgi:lipopolysaccharide/colanic/teichoic acid biosynthesis glycosyltransferase